MHRPLLPVEAPPDPGASQPDEQGHDGAPEYPDAWRRFMFDQVRNAVYLPDHQGRVLEVNASFATLLGVPMPDALQRRVWDWAIDFPQDKALEVLGRDDAGFTTCQSHWQQAAVAVLQVETRIHRLRMPGRQLIFYASCDVSARHSAAQALRESEQRLGVALEASEMGVWEWNLVIQRVCLSADAALRLGRDPNRQDDNECSVAEMLAMVHRDDRASLLAAYDNALQRTGVLVIEARLFGDDGQQRCVRERGVLERAHDGSPLRLVGTLLDITAQRQAAQGLRGDASRRRLMIEPSRDGVVVINDGLDLGKIEPGNLSLAHTHFPMAALLHRTCALVAERARSKGPVLAVLTDGVPPVLCGDPTRLSQAVLDLVRNAVKFTDRGSVVLRCSVLADIDRRDRGWHDGVPQNPAGQYAGGVCLRLSVTDTGVGVPLDKMDRLFSAFAQADAASTWRYGGSGLGLTITRRLAQLMGGGVGVQSVLGQGSGLWFTARLQPATGPLTADEVVGLGLYRAVPAKALLARHRRVGAHVLLAEDNLVNQEIACELLWLGGLVVDVAGDGAQALAVAVAQQLYPDLILMDMQMPVMDDLAATLALRRLIQHACTPVLAMTANAFGDDREAGLDAGMDDRLVKPAEPELRFAPPARWLPDRAPLGLPAHEAAVLTATLSADGARALPAVALAPAATSATAKSGVAGEAAAVAGALDGIPGLTMSRALLYLPGRDALFARVLRQFAESYTAGWPELDAALAQCRWTDAQGLLHSMRGACGAIGATDLAGLSLTLEAALDPTHQAAASPDWSAQAVTLQGALAALVQAISGRLADVAGVAGGRVTPGLPTAELLVAVESLAHLLHTANFKAGACFREIEPVLRGVLGETATRSVEQPLQARDYRTAWLALRALNLVALA